MPDLIGSLFDANSLRFLFLIVMIEETELHCGRVFREQREIDSFAVPGRA
jgi:hypothetical protein